MARGIKSRSHYDRVYRFDLKRSSGSIVSDYGLDDRAIEVRSPTEAEDFSSSPCVQTGSGAHPASIQWVPGVLSLGVKRGRGVTLTTHPHLVLGMSRSYTSSPPSASMACSGTALLLLYSTFRVKGERCMLGYYDVAIIDQETAMVNSKEDPTIRNLVLWKTKCLSYDKQTDDLMSEQP
jgi:hypothetical protein